MLLSSYLSAAVCSVKTGGYVRSSLPDYFYGPGQAPPQYVSGSRSYYNQTYRQQVPMGAAVPGYGAAYTDSAGAMEYYYGGTMDDGAWYPYQEMVAVPQPDPYSTPKSKRSRKPSANVDLTSPSKTMANGSADTPMSPGRRVNKIQKQLFSVTFSHIHLEPFRISRAINHFKSTMTMCLSPI